MQLMTRERQIGQHRLSPDQISATTRATKAHRRLRNVLQRRVGSQAFLAGSASARRRQQRRSPLQRE